MVVYNFKKIQVVPVSNDFIDIILSKTQRKTPTVVHKGYSIQRIRNFYIRKVKFSSQSFHDKLTQILEDFPKLDDIHPFYADLMNVLYDRDHYKLALGQLNTARNLIDTLGKEYVRLLKYGDSLYRCKQLKKASLGRMCTLMKKMEPSLAYLERVRQHLARLPSIDPNTRTLIVCGYPNVGKSSFMNKVTRADVEVQPYAFTTKSLFVGHTDYKQLRWQVIDTPGILDHPLEERNPIEMQSITALAHLRAAILFIVDISEQCGYSIQEQVSLFESIKPLFANKPLMLILNKIDVIQVEQLKAEDRALLEALAAKEGVEMLTMSTMSEVGVQEVKQRACEKLLAVRVEIKLKGRKVNDVLNRLHVATPAPRDSVQRLPSIPESVLARRSGAVPPPAEKRVTEREIEIANGGPGVYNVDLKKYYQLRQPEWRYDIIPEIIDGHNIADFIDPEIEAKLDALEREQEALEADFANLPSDGDEDLDEEERELLGAIRQRKSEIVTDHRLKKGQRSIIPRPKIRKTSEDFSRHLQDLGLPAENAEELVGRVSRPRGRSLSRGAEERGRSQSRMTDGDSDEDAGPRGRQMDDSDTKFPDQLTGKKRGRSLSVVGRDRSNSHARDRSTDGLRTEAQKVKAQMIARKSQKPRNILARAGEADRHVAALKPKHLFSGKRKGGKTDRR
eukprot:TRINITY_DN4144_c0_g1_i1.p1 TRINITY_DN4144_c0_g1~~TRINITY_DN4144_c0_g1_i1.p1  ORF type:complete len:677 (-),score=172.25 TRINITY_DN4144_c0_g1_i1:33-2063(-)